MNRRRERLVARTLSVAYVLVAAAGLLVLAEALFSHRDPRFPRLSGLEGSATIDGKGLIPGSEATKALAEKKMSRAIAAPAATPVAKPAKAPLASLVKLAGIMDFGGRRPSEAVIETPGTNETKGYRVGEPIGSIGATVREITDSVIVEYAGKRYRLTFLGADEVVSPDPGTGKRSSGSDD